MKVKFDTAILGYIATLEKDTGASVRDCVVNENGILFVIKEGDIGKAIGKKGVKIRKISNALGKRVQLVEFSRDVVVFTENLLSPNKAKNILLQEKNDRRVITIESDDETKGVIIGKGGRRIQILKDLLKRHHNIDDVVVK